MVRLLVDELLLEIGDTHQQDFDKWQVLMSRTERMEQLVPISHSRNMQCVFASRFAVLQAVARPKPDRASSPNGSNSAVFPAQIQAPMFKVMRLQTSCQWLLCFVLRTLEVGGSLRPVDKIDSDRHGYVSPQKGHAGSYTQTGVSVLR